MTKEEPSTLSRWLRPDYQDPSRAQTTQTPLALRRASDEGGVPHAPRSTLDASQKLQRPPNLSDRVKAVAKILPQTTEPVTADAVAARFTNARRAAVAEILETLATMGHAHRGKEKGTHLP